MFRQVVQRIITVTFKQEMVFRFQFSTGIYVGEPVENCLITLK